MVTLVYGMPGMGKSTWIHDYLKAHPQHRFFVVDHAEEWGPDAIHWRGKPPPLTVIEARDSVPTEYPPQGIWVFRGRDPNEVATLAVSVGHSTYVDDEIDLTAKKKGWDDSSLRTMVHQGRHAENAQGEFTEVNLIGACRRPQSLHTDLTDLADQICVFRVQGSRTLQRLLSDSTIEDDEWDRIRTLPKFHFRHWPSGGWFEVESVGDQRQGPKAEHPEETEEAA